MDNETPEDASAETPEPAAEETAPVEEESVAEEVAGVVETPAAEEPVAEEPAVEEPATAEESESGEAAADDAESVSELTLGEAPVEDETPPEPRMPSTIRGKIDRFGVAMGTGRRKTSVARVRIKDGSGALTINGRTLDEYFQTDRDRATVVAALDATEMTAKVDVAVRVNGGGTTGQAGAIMLGVARALQAKDPTLHEKLADGAYLTRDSRMVERKKCGYKKARKSFQFSKR